VLKTAMTTTMQKTEVKTTWPVTKLQTEVSAVFMRNMVETFKVLDKVGPEPLKQWYQAWTTMKVDYYKQQGVKTPLELVKAMAEFETNMFGSKMRFWGDEKQAGVEYETCGCWNALEAMKLPKAEMDKLGANCAENTEKMAREFGFTSEMKIGMNPGEPCCTLTFTKK
jgi:hypothetical protein